MSQVGRVIGARVQLEEAVFQGIAHEDQGAYILRIRHRKRRISYEMFSTDKLRIFGFSQNENIVVPIRKTVLQRGEIDRPRKSGR